MKAVYQRIVFWLFLDPTIEYDGETQDISNKHTSEAPCGTVTVMGTVIEIVQFGDLARLGCPSRYRSILCWLFLESYLEVE